MINVSPIGRNCSREERNEFNEYDKVRMADPHGDIAIRGAVR